MAEHGAHLTSGSSDSRQHTPSIFEVLAQESLLSAVRPAVQHVFRVLAERNPSKFSLLYRYCDEIYAVLDLILQNHYLKLYSASFPENFYGLKRVPFGVKETGTKTSTKSEEMPKLSRKTVKTSLFFLVVLPYLRLKMEKLYEDLNRTRESFNTHSKDLRKTLCKAFLGLYPYIHMVLEGATLICQLRYLFKWSDYHSPWLKLAGVTLQSLTEKDVELQMKNINRGPVLKNNSFPRRLCYWLSRFIGGLAILLSNGLSVSVFFLQFLEWWYSSDSTATSLTALPIPDPPKFDRDGGRALDSVCPLCGNMRTNEAALSVSGYVFCYPCIHRYLQEHGACPVTGYPAKTDHLIRIYSQGP